MKTAIVSGASGQCGFYLIDLLLHKGYKVIGVDRRTSLPTDLRIRPLYNNPNLIMTTGDITDLASIENIVKEYKPDEFYNLAAQSFVGSSWSNAITTCQITGLGVLNCLEAVRKFAPECKFYQASSSEMFGNSINGYAILDEESILAPESPYAVAKVFGHHIAHVYRKSYKMFVSTGMMFNSESPLRGEEFVTRKITQSLAAIKRCQLNVLKLGNLNAYRDWTFAGDSVRAMHSILQHTEPNDFVIASGETHQIKEFLDIACHYFELTQSLCVMTDAGLFRPADVHRLLGNNNKIKNALGWTPKVTFTELVHLMCAYDYGSGELYPKGWSYE